LAGVIQLFNFPTIKETGEAMKTISSKNRMLRCLAMIAFAIVTCASLTSANGLDSLNMHTLSSLPDGYCSATAIATVGGHNYLVAGCGSGIKIFDLSADTVPAEAGKIALMGMAERIAVSGTLAYVTVLNYGLVIVDISAPRQPALRGMLSRNGTPHGVAIKGSYAYFTDESGGVIAVSVANLSNPTVAGSLTFGTRTNDIAIAGNYAYVANEDSGLQVVDLAAPAAPARAATCALPRYSWAVALSGHFAYVAVLDSGLQIVDIADPLHPKRTGSWKPDTAAADYPGSFSIDAVTAAGSKVYLSFNDKFWIIDVSDSSLPVLKSSIAYMPYTHNVVSLSGSIAYVPGNYGIAVIGVQQPDAPIVYPALREPNSAICAKISGSTLYVGYGLMFNHGDLFSEG
jgi:hypothetical protein